MYQLPATEETVLDDISSGWRDHGKDWNSDACTPTVDFTYEEYETPVLFLGDHDIKLDENSIAQLCAFYGIPNKFFSRLTAGEQHFLMNRRISHTTGEITVTYNRHGVVDVRKPTQHRLSPDDFISAARRAYSGTARVAEHWLTSDDLRLDILAYSSRDGIRGGVRLTQDRKRNLAPTVHPILYDEESTTTIQIPDRSLRIDARGISPERIVSRLAAEALRAAARTGSDTDALLDLKNTPIADDRDTRLQRIATENGLPTRSLLEITAILGRATEAPTLFDLALAIANAANSPKLRDKRGARTKLQHIAGVIVADHAERCAQCYALIAA